MQISRGGGGCQGGPSPLNENEFVRYERSSEELKKSGNKLDDVR